MASDIRERNANALKCARHILHISKLPGYSNNWYGGETNLAAAYLDLLEENKRLLEATAPGAPEVG